MEKTQRIVSEIYDRKSGKIIKRTVITEKTIIDPKKIGDIEYNQEEQIDVLQNVQDDYLNEMSQVMTENKTCPKCGSKTYKSGSLQSEFNSVYTDHTLKHTGLKCTNKDCNWEHRKTIYGEYGSKMHPDLVKKQSLAGSTTSFKNAEELLARDGGNRRRVNNHLSIKNTVDRVGKILSDIHVNYRQLPRKKYADQLVVQIDGGYIKDKNPRLSSFEVLVAQVYNPENHVAGTKSENGSRVSGEIIKKTCVASAYRDRGQTIRNMIQFAAIKEGISDNTEVTVLSDGAENCWNTAKVLRPYCKHTTNVLDWYHIRHKFETLENKVEDPHLSELESIKWKIWHGESEEALKRLNWLYVDTTTYGYTDKVHELFKYLSNNKEYLVNYSDRKSKKLPFTSSIIESTVESIINERHKKKHKAQWSREGAHNVLQIRTSIASNDWDSEWSVVQDRFYVPRYNKAA
jgi:hypothetical protein